MGPGGGGRRPPGSHAWPGALLRLLEAEHVHRREDAALAALDEGLGDAHEHRVHVDERARDDAQRAEDLDDEVVDEVQVPELRQAVEPGGVGADEDRRRVVCRHEVESDLHTWLWTFERALRPLSESGIQHAWRTAAAASYGRADSASAGLLGSQRLGASTDVDSITDAPQIAHGLRCRYGRTLAQSQQMWPCTQVQTGRHGWWGGSGGEPGVPTCLPADSASLQVRMLGSELPKLISSMTRTCSSLSGSYSFVLTHSWDTKLPPGFSTRKISAYTSGSCIDHVGVVGEENVYVG